MPSPPERERNVFHYLLVRAYQPPSDCAPYLFSSPNTINMSNETRTKVSPRSTYRTTPGPSTLMVLRILPRSGLRRNNKEGGNRPSHFSRYVGLRRCTYPAIWTMSKATRQGLNTPSLRVKDLFTCETTHRETTDARGCRSCSREVLGAIEA